MNGDTQFFCSCGRLLTASPRSGSVVCPACRQRNAVPAAGTAPVSSSSATAVLAPGVGTTLACYRIQRLLGRGGMGQVYEAVHVDTQERVALKTLHPALLTREDFLTRFRREARAASQLEHPNIVRVLDVGLEHSVPFIVMELLDGEDLLSLTRHGAPDEARLIDWMMQAASGLSAAARRGITHRDIKPTNLVLTRNNLLKVADFGLAKATDADSHLTVTGEVLGTPHYMSPEQGQGQAVDFRSDLYSLGAAFYHLLCGRPPFDADTPVAVILKHVKEEPPPLRQIAPHVSVGIERVVHRLLQKSPRERYASYDQLLEDLGRVARGAAPEHGADPPAQRVREGTTTYLLPSERTNELVLQRAGWLRRLMALFLDLVLLELVLWGATWGAHGFQRTPPPWQQDGILFRGSLGDLAAALALLLGFAYFAVSDATGGRSFGKVRLKLRVCRLSGMDLGAARGILRTLLLFPAVTLLSPTLQLASARLIPEHGPLSSEQLGSLGLAYLFALWALGKFAGGGRPLHDLLGGAQVYRVRAAAPFFRRVHHRRTPEPRTAFFLSMIPGVGLMYAGSVWLGLVFLMAIPTVGFTASDPKFLLGLWLFSAVLAADAAARTRRKSEAAGLPQASFLRRQET